MGSQSVVPGWPKQAECLLVISLDDPLDGITYGPRCQFGHLKRPGPHDGVGFDSAATVDGELLQLVGILNLMHMSQSLWGNRLPMGLLASAVKSDLLQMSDHFD